MMRRFCRWMFTCCGLAIGLANLAARCSAVPPDAPAVVDASTLAGRVMCGYQGWFRCPGDAAQAGWIHWSRDRQRLAPDTLTFEMWPDLSEYSAAERFAVPGFTYPDGALASLFSSDHPRTVLRHFEWMRDYGIDGAWLQHFAVDLIGGPSQDRYESRLRVLRHVVAAAEETGRVWALSYDVAGMPGDRIFETIANDWKGLVDERIVDNPRYLHHAGRPVVQIWGFCAHDANVQVTASLINRLIDFFQSRGADGAFLVGGGDWDWRRNSDPAWREAIHRLNAYAPWNVGNYSTDSNGDQHAATQEWAQDKLECEQHGTLWMPVVYPGFEWDNLQRRPAGSTRIDRRGGKFLWEQFHELNRLRPVAVYVAMFDEVDEGTAIFKVTSRPPTQAHFLGYDDLPSDWYLRLVGEGSRMLRGQTPASPEIPIRP